MSKLKTWNHPFGVQVQRFHQLGLHPGLYRTAPNDRTPCDYDPIQPRCIRKPNVNNWQPWQIEHESQEFSKNFGYEHADLLAERKFMRGQLGPGSHDINLGLYKQADVSPCLNQNLGKQKRFQSKEILSPGPAGRYFSKPYTHKVPHVGNTLNRSPRFKELSKSWKLPCNRYTVIHPNSLEALLNKVTSVRGPYDIFTGPRDNANMFNKMSTGTRCSPDKYYNWPSALDVYLRHPKNKMKGKFNKATRFQTHPTCRHLLDDISTCYKNPNWPGPAQYVIPSGITASKEQKYMFGITGLEVRPALKWKISPGPGRYHIKYSQSCSQSKKKNLTSVFMSKTKRTEYKAPIYNAF